MGERTEMKLLDFSSMLKQKFWTKIWTNFFNPNAPWEGGYRNEVMEKMAGDPMLINIM